VPRRCGAERRGRTGELARMAAANRDSNTAGPISAAARNLVVPFVFPRFYPTATGWLYDYDPGELTPAARG
jgi:salicylate hydroxylase